MEGRRGWVVLVVAMVLATGAMDVGIGAEEGTSNGGGGGGEDGGCARQLVACVGYLNGTKRDVPSSCCDPLKQVIQSVPECICSMISNQGASQAQRAGINLTQAQLLPARCGISLNPLGCLTAYGPASSSNNAGDSWSRRSLLLPWLTVTAATLTSVAT